MPTQLFVFVYWEKGYTKPIRCQRAWAAHRNSTLKGGAATERDGKGLDALATNFNLLTRLASHYPFALFVGDNHLATRGHALQFESRCDSARMISLKRDYNWKKAPRVGDLRSLSA